MKAGLTSDKQLVCLGLPVFYLEDAMSKGEDNKISNHCDFSGLCSININLCFRRTRPPLRPSVHE